MKNGKRKSDGDLLALLDKFEGMMRMMIDSGVTYHSFKHHVSRLYVAAAVDMSDGNYTEAARKIGLHHNNVRVIMRTRKARQDAEHFEEANSGEPISG